MEQEGSESGVASASRCAAWASRGAAAASASSCASSASRRAFISASSACNRLLVASPSWEDASAARCSTRPWKRPSSSVASIFTPEGPKAVAGPRISQHRFALAISDSPASSTSSSAHALRTAFVAVVSAGRSNSVRIKAVICASVQGSAILLRASSGGRGGSGGEHTKTLRVTAAVSLGSP